MIQGFDKETAPLNDYERDVLLPQLLRGLSRKHGKANRITSGKIIEGMRDHGYKLDAPRLRKLINHIRTQGLIPCLVAHSFADFKPRKGFTCSQYLTTLY